METVEKFEEAARNLPRSQAKVADYIAKHPAEVAFMTVEQLAQKAKVSTATVMRLAASRGYSGYSDMMQAFKDSLIKEATPFSRFLSGSKEKSDDQFAENFVKKELEMLHATMSYNSYDTILKAAKMISEGKRIYVVGYRISYVVATYLYQGFQRVTDNCQLMTPTAVDFLEKLSRVGKGDVVIGCVLPRYYSQVPDVLKTAKELGAKTVLITDSYNSPAAAYADILLPCSCDSASFHASILGTVYVVDYLVSVFAKQNPEFTGEQLNKMEKIFSEYRKKI